MRGEEAVVGAKRNALALHPITQNGLARGKAMTLFLCQLLEAGRGQFTHIYADVVKTVAQLTRHHTTDTVLTEPVDSKTLRM